MADVGIFYGHLMYFTVVWYILWTFDIFCGFLVIFFLFGMLYQEKSGNRGFDFFLLSNIKTLRNVSKQALCQGCQIFLGT
jgi:hypothetical protein